MNFWSKRNKKEVALLHHLKILTSWIFPYDLRFWRTISADDQDAQSSLQSLNVERIRLISLLSHWKKNQTAFMCILFSMFKFLHSSFQIKKWWKQSPKRDIHVYIVYDTYFYFYTVWTFDFLAFNISPGMQMWLSMSASKGPGLTRVLQASGEGIFFCLLPYYIHVITHFVNIMHCN